MSTLETNPKILNLAEHQHATSREVSAQDLAWLHEQVPHVHIVHFKEEHPITASKTEEDFNDYSRGYPFLIPTDNQWQLAYYPRYETNRTHATLSGNWTALSMGEVDSEVNNSARLPERFQAVIQMINFCKQQGWHAVEIASGTEFMKWAVWAYCDYLEMPVTGYEPSDHDQTRQSNVSSVMMAASQAFSQPLVPAFVRAGAGSVDDDDEIAG